MQQADLKWLESSPVAHLNQHLFGKVVQVKKKSKYNNIKTVDEFGNVYDSKKEAKRAGELRLLLKAGEIAFLEMQVPFDLEVCKYICDFMYFDKATGKTIVEDVKSEITKKLPVYRIKRRLMFKLHGIIIKEV